MNRFDLLDTSPFVGQTDGEPYATEIAYETGSVLNGGFGLEYDLSGSLSMFGSVITDYSSLPEEDANLLAVTVWDLYHVSTGGVMNCEPFDLALGSPMPEGANRWKTSLFAGAPFPGTTLLPSAKTHRFVL